MTTKYSFPDNLTEYPFPDKDNLEASRYRLFPEDLEADDNVVFHGTSRANAVQICSNEFISGESLDSVSFFEKSSIALGYACKRRSSESPDGCVLAVRYDSLEREGIRLGGGILHDDTLNPQPEIIGYCIVPKSYLFI